MVLAVPLARLLRMDQAFARMGNAKLGFVVQVLQIATKALRMAVKQILIIHYIIVVYAEPHARTSHTPLPTAIKVSV